MTGLGGGVPGGVANSSTTANSSAAGSADAAVQRAVQKAAIRFVPLLTIAYLFNYLDRTSLSVAALTMNQQLGLTPAQFGLAAGIFFLSYSTFEIPSNLLLYRVGARRWIARIMISWGLVSAATGLRDRPEQLLRPAISARHHGSRFLSRRDVLSRRVVSDAIPHADAGLVPGRHSHVFAGRHARFAACCFRWTASGVCTAGSGCSCW